MRRWLLAALALGLSPIGGADAHGNRDHGPVTTICHWGGTAYTAGGYCTAACARGACDVEVCLGEEQWINMGPCLGDECRRAC